MSTTPGFDDPGLIAALESSAVESFDSLGLDFVFTFRMRPTPVRLRLMAAAGSPRQYLLIRPR